MGAFQLEFFPSLTVRAALGESMQKLKQYFIVSAGVILLNTALVKILSSFGQVEILKESDPLFHFLTNREVMVLVACLEFVMVFTLIFAPSEFHRLVALCWISSCFLLYRAALLTLGVEECPCLGSATAWLTRDRMLMNRLMACVAFYLFLGSAFFLWPQAKSLAGSVAKDGSGSATRPNGLNNEHVSHS